jgi:hypothetical protein
MKLAELFISLLLPFSFISCSATNQSAKEINSYEECVAAGYPILKTYPPQCITPDGRVFIKGKAGAVKK